MSTTPKVNKKPKYNKNDAFRWVDSQWEKFMTQQKEDKKIIEQLREDLLTCNSHFQKQRTRVLQLEMRLADLTDEYIDMGGDPKQLELFEEQSKQIDIFESPDGGKTVYKRQFNNYNNRKKI